MVKNSGAIEASGISQRAGRIVLDASQTLTQTSTGLVDVSGSIEDTLMERFAREIDSITRRLEAGLVLKDATPG